MKKFLWTIFVFCWCLGASAQKTIKLVGNIEDELSEMPLKGVRISVLNPDSTVVVDSAEITEVKDSNGNLVKVLFQASVKDEKRNYLIRAIRPGYVEVWQPFSVLFPGMFNSVGVPTIRMSKERSLTLKEVEVKATKVKMYYKGDTLVYNADAFQLPDGSMLDELIRQLPGVTMKGGEIFVNGRKVDELLLGSRTFFRGNKEVLLENLPHYTVKDLKVYEKQTDMSEALGHDVEPRRYVMDVNLKPEYRHGYIANVEAAGGTGKCYLGRAFLLGFTDRWRYALVGNFNNVSETQHVGNTGYWRPSAPNQTTTIRSVGTDINYQNKDGWLQDAFNAKFTSTSNQSEMRQRYEQFFEENRPISFTRMTDHSGDQSWNLSNDLTLKKNVYANIRTYFDYMKRNGSFHSDFEYWNDSLATVIRSMRISKGRNVNGKVEMNLAFNLVNPKEQNNDDGKNDIFQRHLNLNIAVIHNNDQSESSDYYNTRNYLQSSREVRYNASDYLSRNTASSLHTYYTIKPGRGIDININETFSMNKNEKHDFLYHPDTLMLASQLDALSAITDPSNSYTSSYFSVNNTLRIELSKAAVYKSSPNSLFGRNYSPFTIGVALPVNHTELDYQRGSLDTLAQQTTMFVNPYFTFRHIWADSNREILFQANHTRSASSLYDRITYRDDSQPLVVKLGNPSLKGNAFTTLAANYTDRTGQKMLQQFHIGTSFNYQHRNVAQSVTYNPVSGVYTYKPMNIRGAYSVNMNLNFSRGLDKHNNWTLQTAADAGLQHSVDHAMFAGDTESHENIVNTLALHNNTYVQYNKGTLNLRATGDITWRHSEGNMYDFDQLDAFDYRYGFSARYTLPRIKTSLSADGTMYSRRGYGNSNLNTDDFILNASLSQPFLKGKLIARIEGFDLLHQLSSTQYEVNAQGRTETWYRSLPHYVMFHLVYHWNRNPKRP